MKKFILNSKRVRASLNMLQFAQTKKDLRFALNSQFFSLVTLDKGTQVGKFRGQDSVKKPSQLDLFQ